MNQTSGQLEGFLEGPSVAVNLCPSGNIGDCGTVGGEGVIIVAIIVLLLLPIVILTYVIYLGYKFAVASNAVVKFDDTKRTITTEVKRKYHNQDTIARTTTINYDDLSQIKKVGMCLDQEIVAVKKNGFKVSLSESFQMNGQEALDGVDFLKSTLSQRGVNVQ